MSLNSTTAQTVDLRGGEVNFRVYEDDSIPVLFEVAADLTDAEVTLTLYGDETITLTVADDELTVQVDKGINSETGAVIDRTGYSVVSIARQLTSDEWDDLLAPGGVPYELRYELDEEAFTPWRGRWTVTKRVGA